MNTDQQWISPGAVVLDPQDKRWFTFVDHHPKANIFHHPSWMRLIEKCYGYRPRVLAILNDQKEICAGLPYMEVNSWLTGKRWVSLPFTDHCKPLVDSDDSLARLVSWFEYAYHANQVPQIELRWSLPGTPGLKRGMEYITHTISLSRDVQSLEKKLKRTHKQNISTAENRGVTVQSGNQLEQIHHYYQLQLETRRRHGVPAQPWTFFRELAQTLFSQGLGFVLLAFYEKECIAGIVFLHWHDTMVAKYAASKEDTLQLRPNNLLFWKGIEWACEHGYSVFDFGRTEATNSGLRRYKRGWGAIEEPLSYSFFSDKAIPGQNGKSQQLTQSLIRKSPLWLCRVSGELLYRHFG